MANISSDNYGLLTVFGLLLWKTCCRCDSDSGTPHGEYDDFEKIFDFKNSGLVVYSYVVHAEKIKTDTGMEEILLHDTNDVESPPRDNKISNESCKNTCARCIHIYNRAEGLLRNISSYKREVLAVCTRCGYKTKHKELDYCKCEDIVKTFLISSIKDFNEDQQRVNMENDSEVNRLKMQRLSHPGSNLHKATKKNIVQMTSHKQITSLERKYIQSGCSCQNETNDNLYETLSEIKKSMFDETYRFIFPSEKIESNIGGDVSSSILVHDLQVKDKEKKIPFEEKRDNDLERIKFATENTKVLVDSRKSYSFLNPEEKHDADDLVKQYDVLNLRGKGKTNDKLTLQAREHRIKQSDNSKLRDKAKVSDKGENPKHEHERTIQALKESANSKPTYKKKTKKTAGASETVNRAKQFNKEYLKETGLLIKYLAKQEKHLKEKAKWEKEQELVQKKAEKLLEKKLMALSIRKSHKYVVPLPSIMESDKVNSKPSLTQLETETTRSEITNTTSKSKTASAEKLKQVDENDDGVIRFALSDRKFIDMGWTVLPTEKVVRKMNIYRMHPSHPEFDWFAKHKSKGKMQYNSGETLAEFSEDGRGRWFYRNGHLALDYYTAEESKAGQRYVVYSSGEPDERGYSRPLTVLAAFDHSGNGIVFDHCGEIRLKYNQSEGVVLDRSIGPESHWKWHALNDPPVLQQVSVDTEMPLKDPRIQKICNPGEPSEAKLSTDNADMVAIEYNNFIKERLINQREPFKPYQIKMKAFKINERISLRILDQATVYLIFRDGSSSIKINIGMSLDHSDIVDTVICDVGHVCNALERYPARTGSIAALQRAVTQAHSVERARVRHERRLRPPLRSASVDRLRAGLSRPLDTNSFATLTKSKDEVPRKYAPGKRFSYNIKCDD